MTNQPVRTLVLYSCTFRKDLKRTVKLAQSIQKHNRTNIPFYVSVPEEDVSLFKECLSALDVTVFNEKEIFEKNPKLDKPFLKKTIKGKTEYLSLKTFRKKHLELNELEKNDFGGCGCFIDE